MGFWTDNSTHNVGAQESCAKVATAEGLKWAAGSLAVSTVVILGACKAFPRFNRSLSVSSRTALIVMPPFGFFFLKAELAMNDCARQQSAMRLAAQRAAAAS